MRLLTWLVPVLSAALAFAQNADPSATPATPTAAAAQTQSSSGPAPQPAPAPQDEKQPSADPSLSPPVDSASATVPAEVANPATPAAATPASSAAVAASKAQPKRILGIMPNYRAVSAGDTPPPPTPKQAFKIATQNSFDYSSFMFVGITSALAEGTDAHPKLGKGLSGFGRYYWRGYLDKTDGNYLVIFALPTVFRQDERYYAMGEGGFWKRAVYSSSRVLITPNYHGHDSVNFSEILGRGMAQGIALSYYPSSDRTLGAIAVKYGYAMGRDALTNVFREFWPDIATHVLHRHP